MTSRKLYAAYGRYMNINQMKRITNDADLVGKGSIENYELQFRNLATIAKRKKFIVPVVLWSIPETAVCNLDKYEGRNSGLYKKEVVKVKLEELSDKAGQFLGNVDLDEVDAMVYILIDEFQPISQPTLAYYNLIFEGYRQNGLDVRPLATALIKTWAKYDEHKLVKLDGFTEEEMQLLYTNLTAKWLLEKNK